MCPIGFHHCGAEGKEGTEGIKLERERGDREASRNWKRSGMKRNESKGVYIGGGG